MFYFCFKAGSSPELQEDTQLFTFQHKRMRRWRVVGHSWAAYATQKTSSQPRAWLMPSPVSETVFRCCGRKHGGLLLGTEGPQCPWEAWWDGGYLSPPSPHRCWVLSPGHSIQLFLFTCVFLSGIASHNSAFPNIQVFGSIPRDCSGGCMPPPSASSSSTHPTAHIPQLGRIHHTTKTHGDSHHRGLKALNIQYQQQDLPHSTLNSSNAEEAFQDCFTAPWWNGLSSSFLSGSYFSLFKLDKLYLAR